MNHSNRDSLAQFQGQARLRRDRAAPGNKEKRMRLSTLLASAAASAVMATAANDQVVVSYNVDTEVGVLGNIVKQVFEANDIPVEERSQLGGTPIVRVAITAGEIDI